jgi:nucleoid-associated protein YgaU
MEIWLKQGSERIRLPVLPNGYEFTEPFKNTTVDIANFGEVNIIGKKALATTSISSFFPNKNYSFIAYKGFPTPKNCVKLIKSWMDNPVRLTITGTGINLLMTIENFTYSEQDGTGDIYYSLDLKEYRVPKLVAKANSKITATTTKIVKPVSSRDTKTVKTTVVTVKKGDTISKIVKKATGSSSNSKAVINQNKISHPNNLKPGQQVRMVM